MIPEAHLSLHQKHNDSKQAVHIINRNLHMIMICFHAHISSATAHYMQPVPLQTHTHTYIEGTVQLVEEGEWGHRGLGLKVKDNESAKTPSQGNIIHNWGRGPGHFSTVGPQTWLWVQTPRLLYINMGTEHR